MNYLLSNIILSLEKLRVLYSKRSEQTFQPYITLIKSHGVVPRKLGNIKALVSLHSSPL